jgi:Helix-turn-helix domain
MNNEIITVNRKKSNPMSMTIITKEDLEEFRVRLLDDIRQIITPKEAKLIKPWLKNAEVMKFLEISANTLQRLRVSGKLSASKVGGIHYYRYEDIEKLLNSKAA